MNNPREKCNTINVSIGVDEVGTHLYINDFRVYGPKPVGGGELLFNKDISIDNFVKAFEYSQTIKVEEK